MNTQSTNICLSSASFLITEFLWSDIQENHVASEKLVIIILSMTINYQQFYVRLFCMQSRFVKLGDNC